MKDYTPVLCGLGLCDSEARVFLALLSKESLTAREVVHITGLSKQMAYTVLRKLQERGFCSLVSGATKLYRASPPGHVLGGLMGQQESNLKKAKSVIARLEAVYEEAQSMVRPLEYIEIVKERRQIVDRFFRLINATRESLYIFSLGPYATGSQLKNEPGEASLRRGVDVRAIYEAADLTEPVVIDHMRKFAALGEKSRVIRGLPMKLVIFDQLTVLCALKDPLTGKQTLTSLIIEHPDYARSMTILFDHYWSAALTLDQFLRTREGHELIRHAGAA